MGNSKVPTASKLLVMHYSRTQSQDGCSAQISTQCGTCWRDLNLQRRVKLPIWLITASSIYLLMTVAVSVTKSLYNNIRLCINKLESVCHWLQASLTMIYSVIESVMGKLGRNEEAGVVE